MFRRRKKAIADEAPEAFSYDRDTLVGYVQRHYELLVRMGHLAATAIQQPPAGGWTDAVLHVEALRALGRDETVIDLLRHLPYARAGDGPDTDGAVVHYATFALSYLRAHWRPEQEDNDDDDDDGMVWHRRPLAILGLAPFDGPMDAHLIALTRDEAQIGTVWIVDTQRGCIYPHGDDYFLYDEAPRAAVGRKPWLRARAVSFPMFFDTIYRDISSLKFVPVPAAGNFGPAICAPKDLEAAVSGRTRCWVVVVAVTIGLV